jgi:hypothetical protein
MNYEDMDIAEYYRRQEAKHEELVGCYAALIVIMLCAAVIYAVGMAVAWLLT